MSLEERHVTSEVQAQLGMWLVVLAGILWGVTNPLLKRFTAGFADKKKTAGAGLMADLRFLAQRPKYLATQGLNFAGSVAFGIGMGSASLSVGPAVANGISMALTCAVSSLVLHEEPMTRRQAIGVTLIFTGLLLCVTAPT